MAEYQNPQQEPGGERRLLLVLLAVFILMLATQPLLKKYFPQPTVPSQTQPSGQTQPQTQPAPAPGGAAAAPESTSPARPASRATRQAASETETVIENDLYRITFTNKGAQVKSWILKKFKNDTQSGPLDLVNPVASEKFGYPLSLWTYDEGIRDKLTSVLYVPSRSAPDSGADLGATQISVTTAKGELAPQTLTAPAHLSFEYSDQDLTVTKTFHFDETYVVGIETSVIYRGSPVSAMPAWPAGFGDQTTPAFYAASFVDYQFSRNIERLPARCGFSLFSKCNAVVGGATLPGPFHWAGATDQYFAAVFIPDNPASATLVTLHNPLALPRDPQKPDPNQTVNVDVLGTAVGSLHGTTSERIFVGPKELEVLQKVSIPGVADNDLNGLVDFGFFGIIAKPLFLWLKWTYHHMVANWGWAIVLQTFLITLALAPLRVYQTHSMYKMQKIAPQMKAIQDRYKKYSLRDPRKQEMQKEIYALQQKEGVNPLAGCLPMLIQLPFLYAYYRMLSIALDLRHAHWLWIRDLSAADPYYLLPLFMVVSMLVTQKMTPQAGMDPAQQRMMNVMMPLMMGFIFFRLPAGLNLYYAESNLISIAQQSLMNRTKLGREMRELMAKRARKKEKDK